MKKIFLSVFLVLSLNDQNLEIDKIRTDLYMYLIQHIR
ncbi:hypothetical protein ACISN4_09935, partial [Campylobacter jejuni]